VSDDRQAPQFWFFKEWRDNQGRPWAEPHYYQQASDARKAHSAAAEFFWSNHKMFRPHISALFARDRLGVVVIQQDCWKGDNPNRVDDVTSPPIGAVQVSSVVKAEVQRRDPGSSPGGSTDLPF
jgi:hypothetical protein